MTKRKLTIRQTAVVSKQQQKHLLQAKQAPIPEEGTSVDAVQTGLLVALYGTEAEIESAEGIRCRCRIRQNLGTIVVGDRVIWRGTHTGSGVIEAVQPRKTLLSRPAKDGRLKAIAANVDQVLVVIAPQPRPAAKLLDSYLVAIETLGLQPIILFNKTDVLTTAERNEFQPWLAIYRELAYPLIEVSAAEQQGISELQKLLKQRTSVFVGQSGVGKSSLLRCLLPEDAIRIGATTEHTHGLHTTTTARLYHLPSGGAVIDSPGVRDFILWRMSTSEVAAGFKEFHDYLQRCRFRDCDHLSSHGCALRIAVQEGQISAQRYNSYQRIVEFLADVKG